MPFNADPTKKKSEEFCTFRSDRENYRYKMSAEEKTIFQNLKYSPELPH